MRIETTPSFDLTELKKKIAMALETRLPVNNSARQGLPGLSR